MNNLKKLRSEINFTVRELSEKVGISSAALSYLENENRPFRQIHIDKLTNFFRVTSDYLLGKSSYGYVVYLEDGIDEVILSEEEYNIYKDKMKVAVYNVENSSCYSMTSYLDEKGNRQYYNQSLEGVNFIVERMLTTPIKKDIVDYVQSKLDNLTEQLTEEQKQKVIKFIEDYIL